MKQNQIKIAFALILGLAGVESAQAQATYNSDLLAGFTTASGTDTVYDLGAVSSLTNGISWDLGPLLTNAPASYTLSTVNWGIIASVTSNHYQYLTYNSGPGVQSGPPAIPSFGTWNSINTSVKAVYNNDFTAAGEGNYAQPLASLSYSWNDETLNPIAGTDYVNEFGISTPDSVGVDTTFPFWACPDNGSTPVQIGNFSLSDGGVLTFTTLSANPPTPKIVAFNRSGTTDSIYFTTTNGSFTYTLYYTNASGLTAPVTNWIASPTTVVGNGNTNVLTDTSTDANRFYRIGVH